MCVGALGTELNTVQDLPWIINIWDYILIFIATGKSISDCLNVKSEAYKLGTTVHACNSSTL